MMMMMMKIISSNQMKQMRLVWMLESNEIHQSAYHNTVVILNAFLYCNYRLQALDLTQWRTLYWKLLSKRWGEACEDFSKQVDAIFELNSALMSHVGITIFRSDLIDGQESAVCRGPAGCLAGWSPGSSGPVVQLADLWKQTVFTSSSTNYIFYKLKCNS